MITRFVEKLAALFSMRGDPVTIEELYERELPKEVQEILERQTYKFDVAHSILMERFGIIPSRARSYTKVMAFLYKLLSKEEATKMHELMKRPDGRRAAFNFMVEMHDITPYMLNSCFPLGEKRDQFERWLDETLNQLP